jgi:hypothetical protein
MTFAADLPSVVRLPKQSDDTRHRYALLPDLAHARISRPAASRLHKRYAVRIDVCLQRGDDVVIVPNTAAMVGGARAWLLHTDG